MFFVNERWLGGMLTNFELEAMEAEQVLSTYCRERSYQLADEMEKLTKCTGTIEDIKLHF